MTWLVAVLVAVWVVRVAVEVRRWYWVQRRENALTEVARLSAPRSHVTLRHPDPFDQDAP